MRVGSNIIARSKPYITCPLCNYDYSYPNRFDHFGTRRHRQLMLANGEDMTEVNAYAERRQAYEKQRELRRFPKTDAV